MNIESLTSQAPAVQGSERPPAELRQRQLKQASEDFEAMLVQQMFQSMQKTLESGSLVGNGLSGSVYSGLLVESISKDMASHQSLGLAKQLYSQVLKREPEVQKLEEADQRAKQQAVQSGVKMGQEGIPLENLRRGMGSLQMIKAEPLLKMASESAKNADIGGKVKL